MSDYEPIEVGDTALEQAALRIWQKREAGWPKRLQRMRPDTMDRVTGAWAWCLRKAAATPNTTDTEE